MSLFYKITKLPVEEFFEQLRNVTIYGISKNNSEKTIICRKTIKAALEDYLKNNFYAFRAAADNNDELTHIKISDNQLNLVKHAKAWLYTTTARNTEKNSTSSGYTFTVTNPPKPESINIADLIKECDIQFDTFKTAGTPASRKAKSQKIFQIIKSELNAAGPLAKKYLKIIFFDKDRVVKKEADAWLVAEANQCHFLINIGWEDLTDAQEKEYIKQDHEFMNNCNKKLKVLNIELINNADYKDIKIIDPSKEK